MIHGLEQWGISLILSIQAAAMPTLDRPMRILSGMGEEVFYIIVIPFLYWCVHRKVGFRLFVFLLVSAIVNSIGKWALSLPRPYWLEAKIRAMYIETGFGAPSGHSQNALGVWGYLALLLDRFLGIKSFYYVAATLAVVISFSRLYLGVHFPHDIISGWILAALLIAAFLFLQERTATFTNEARHSSRTALSAALLTGALCLLAWVTLAAHGSVPADWAKRALAAHTAMGKPIAISPYEIKTLVSAATLLVVAGVALPFAARVADFDPTGPWSRRILRYALGIIVLGGLYVGLAKLLPSQGEPYYYVGRVGRYAVLGLWMFVFAPYTFIKLGLAQTRPR